MERLNQNVRYRSRAGSRTTDVEEIAALGKMSLANVYAGSSSWLILEVEKRLSDIFL